MRLKLLYRSIRIVLLLLLVLAGAWIAYACFKPRPEDLPWTPLSLDQPIGAMTGRKLTALTADPARCMALLTEAGLKFQRMPPHEGACPVQDAVRLRSSQDMLSLSPASVAPACPVVAGLALWQWRAVAPVAHRLFNASVVKIHHYGSFACRRMYGRETGAWSEHASADAIDVSGFTLSDGTEISVARDWSSDGKKGEFLHAVRDEACRLFSTVLSPDYNAQHQDHFHLDQADRGKWGWRACR
jgi:hypothetical protein